MPERSGTGAADQSYAAFMPATYDGVVPGPDSTLQGRLKVGCKSRTAERPRRRTELWDCGPKIGRQRRVVLAEACGPSVLFAHMAVKRAAERLGVF